MKCHDGSCYNGYSVQASEGLSIRTDILDAIIERVEYMSTRFSRVLFVRFDLCYPQYSHAPQSNDDLSRFLNSFCKYLSREGVYHQYVWVREHSSGNIQHYHLMLLLNGNVTRNSYGHLLKAEGLWQCAIAMESAGLLHRCNPYKEVSTSSAQVMLDRNDALYRQKINDCIKWASYLAKVNTKGDAPFRTREWGATSIGC